MIPRKKIEYEIDIAIKQNQDFKCDITWGDFLNSIALLPTDKIVQFKWKEDTYIPPFSMDDQEITNYTFCVVVSRTREETDEEYFNRLKKEEQQKAEFEKKERLEYLRLKAKFDVHE